MKFIGSFVAAKVRFMTHNKNYEARCKKSLSISLSRQDDNINVCKSANQECQTYGPRAKTDPLRDLFRPVEWFCKVKTSLFAWEVYPIILQ